MAEKNFSWIEEIEKEQGLEVTPPSLNKKEKIKRFIENKKSILVIFVLFLTLILLKIFDSNSEPQLTTKKLPVMMAVLPIPKGQLIDAMLLRPAQTEGYALSKTQKIQRLVPGDAEKIMGKVRAKKDIPPNKVIFWNELELIPDKIIKNIPRAPVVLYPENI